MQFTQIFNVVTSVKLKRIGLGIFMILLGYLLSIKKFKHLVMATIKSSLCERVGGKYYCDVSLEYLVKGKIYQQSLTDVRQRSPLSPGDKIPIFYDSYNPQNIQYGFVTLIISTCLAVIGASLVYSSLTHQD